MLLLLSLLFQLCIQQAEQIDEQRDKIKCDFTMKLIKTLKHLFIDEGPDL